MSAEVEDIARRRVVLNLHEWWVDDNTVIIPGFDTITETRDGWQITARGRVTFAPQSAGSIG